MQKQPTLEVFNICFLWIITDWYNCNKISIFLNRMQFLLSMSDYISGFQFSQISIIYFARCLYQFYFSSMDCPYNCTEIMKQNFWYIKLYFYQVRKKKDLLKIEILKYMLYNTNKLYIYSLKMEENIILKMLTYIIELKSCLHTWICKIWKHIVSLRISKFKQVWFRKEYKGQNILMKLLQV